MMLESKIENKVCIYAKEHDWLQFKFVSPSSRGVPDRIFMKAGIVVFIEFKAKGKKPTPLQERKIAAIKAKGCNVHVADSIEAGKAILDTYDL